METLHTLVERIKQKLDASPDPASENRDTTLDTYSDIKEKFWAAAYSGDAAGMRSFVAEFKTFAQNQSDPGVQAEADVFDSFCTFFCDLSRFDLSDALIDEFYRLNLSRPSWEARFVTHSAVANLYADNHQRTRALEAAQAALKEIPETLGGYESHARADVNALIAKLHNIQANPAMALDATAQFLSAIENGDRQDDVIDLLNNLLFAYSRSRNHEAEAYLSAELREISARHEGSVAGLTEMRIASAAVNLGDYDLARKTSDEGLAKAGLPVLKRNLRIINSMALAGLGQTEPAHAKLSEAGIAFSPDMPVADVPSAALQTLMLTALNTGQTDRARQLFDRRLDREVQKILGDINADTASTIAILENSRERQAERESAAERELSLREITIAKQRVLNRVLTLLSVLLLLGAISAVAFARYRDQISKALAVKTREAESADRMKSEFLGMVSHELRTPLNGIIGISDLLANTHPDPDIRHKTGIVLKSGNDLYRVIERIVDMSRIEGGKLELFPGPENLAEIVRRAAVAHEEPATDKGLIYTYHVDPALDMTVSCDREKVAQCLQHLIENAVRFTEAGRIHIHATVDTSDEVPVLSVIVADTGQGMSEAVQSRLFTPFLQADNTMTRKFGGSGLSLAIARETARMMDGDVTVTSREGRGSEFKLTLAVPRALPKPAVARSQEQAVQAAVARDIVEPPSKDTPPPGRTEGVIDLMQSDRLFAATPVQAEDQEIAGTRILLVEDIASNRMILRHLLEPQGCIVSEVDSGEAALAYLAAHSVDMIVLDIHMPGMSGIETARQLRASGHANAAKPIIALTADAEAETNAACMAAGTDLFLNKPVIRQELLDAIAFIRRTHRRGETLPGLLKA